MCWISRPDLGGPLGREVRWQVPWSKLETRKAFEEGHEKTLLNLVADHSRFDLEHPEVVLEGED